MSYVIGAYEGSLVAFRAQDFSWTFPDIVVALTGLATTVEGRTGTASTPTSWDVTLANFPAGMEIHQDTDSTDTGVFIVTEGALSSLSLEWAPTEGQSYFIEDGRQRRPRFWIIGIQIDGRGNWEGTQFELRLSIEVSDRRLVASELPEIESESERIYGPARALPMPWYRSDALDEAINRRWKVPPRMVVHTLPFVQESMEKLEEVVEIEPGQFKVAGTSPVDATQAMNAVVTSVELQVGRAGKGLSFKLVTLIERFDNRGARRASKDIAQSVLRSANSSIAPSGVAVDADGDVLVSDNNAHAVWGFRNGARHADKDITQSALQSANSSIALRGVAVDADGDVLVSDTNADAVWGFRNGARHADKDIAQSVLRSANSSILPGGVAVDADGDVLVSDDNADAVWGFRNGARHADKDITQSVLQSANSSITPRGVVVDADGYVLVVDWGADAVWGFRNGARRASKDIAQSALRSANSSIIPLGVAVDADGDVLVSDANADAVWGFYSGM